MECARLDCDAPVTTVLTYTTCPHKEFPLCGPHRTDALAWIRSRWGAAATVTESPLGPEQPALFSPEEV